MSLNGALRSLNSARSHGARVHLRRLFVAPSIEAFGAGDPAEGRRATYQVDGLVCGVCAARTERALSSVPGVEAAAVDLDTSRVMLRLSPGASVDVSSLQGAIEDVVIGMGLRRRIERTAKRLTSNLVRS